LQNNQNTQIFEYKIELNSQISSNIFLQATRQASITINKIIQKFILVNFFGKIKFPKIADLYSGFGNYSFALATFFKYKIFAFEESEEMVQIIKQNAQKYQLPIQAKRQNLFENPLNKSEIDNFDLIIINPPRSGSLRQIKEISLSRVNFVIYVSCNLNSFVRDAKILNDNFYLLNFFALDQFYGSQYFEIIAIFVHK